MRHVTRIRGCRSAAWRINYYPIPNGKGRDSWEHISLCAPSLVGNVGTGAITAKIRFSLLPHSHHAQAEPYGKSFTGQYLGGVTPTTRVSLVSSQGRGAGEVWVPRVADPKVKPEDLPAEGGGALHLPRPTLQAPPPSCIPTSRRGTPPAVTATPWKSLRRSRYHVGVVPAPLRFAGNKAWRSCNILVVIQIDNLFFVCNFVTGTN